MVYLTYHATRCDDDYREWAAHKLSKRYPKWNITLVDYPSCDNADINVDLVMMGLPDCEVEHVYEFISGLWLNYYG